LTPPIVDIGWMEEVTNLLVLVLQKPHKGYYM